MEPISRLPIDPNHVLSVPERDFIKSHTPKHIYITILTSISRAIVFLISQVVFIKVRQMLQDRDSHLLESEWVWVVLNIIFITIINLGFNQYQSSLRYGS